MTNDKKAKIIAMRKSGLSYAQIAEDLSISINTIKTFCRRNRNITDSGIAVCKQCGAKIKIQDKCKPKQFCSDRCRAAWWYANNGKRKTEYHLQCANCGREFVSVGSKARKYCSHECYIAARFSKERGGDD